MQRKLLIAQAFQGTTFMQRPPIENSTPVINTAISLSLLKAIVSATQRKE